MPDKEREAALIEAMHTEDWSEYQRLLEECEPEE